jgi:hypothetical protein
MSACVIPSCHPTFGGTSPSYCSFRPEAFYTFSPPSKSIQERKSDAMPFSTAIRSSLQGPTPAFGFWLTYVQFNLHSDRSPGLTPPPKTAEEGRNSCKKLMANINSIYSLPSTGLAKTILHGASGSSTRFSWVLVDAEHGAISDQHYYDVSDQPTCCSTHESDLTCAC